MNAMPQSITHAGTVFKLGQRVHVAKFDYTGEIVAIYPVGLVQPARVRVFDEEKGGYGRTVTINEVRAI